MPGGGFGLLGRWGPGSAAQGADFLLRTTPASLVKECGPLFLIFPPPLKNIYSQLFADFPVSLHTYFLMVVHVSRTRTSKINKQRETYVLEWNWIPRNRVDGLC